MCSNTVAAALHEAENERDVPTVQLSAATEATRIDLWATLDDAASDFARMIDELPQHLDGRETAAGACFDRRLDPVKVIRKEVRPPLT